MFILLLFVPGVLAPLLLIGEIGVLTVGDAGDLPLIPFVDVTIGFSAVPTSPKDGLRGTFALSGLGAALPAGGNTSFLKKNFCSFTASLFCARAMFSSTFDIGM